MLSSQGNLMPVQYSGIVAEHNAVRNECGMFDVSHMGEIEVRLGQWRKKPYSISPAMIFRDGNRTVRYSPMCNERGGTVGRPLGI